jgi:benzoylformate decarboxylase
MAGSVSSTTSAHANAAAAFVATLHANGIDTIFGLPGSTEAPLLEALRADGGIRYVLTLQESITVAMADGYARATGKIGCVGLHTSVGTMNGLSQLYNAFRDGSALVVTAGHKDAGVAADDGFCALPDLAALPRTFTKLSWQSLTSNAVAGDLRRALHVAAAPPSGPAYLALPEDLLTGDAGEEGETRALAAGATARRSLRRRPDPDAVAAAAALLATARRPILVLGSAAVEARAQARALAEALELPVFAIDRTQLSALPYSARETRYLGLYGDDRSLIEDADCVLVVGARLFFPFSSDSRPALPRGARVIHADDDPAQVGRNVTPDVGMSGDPETVLADLHAAVEQRGGIPAETRAERIARLAELRERFETARTRERERANDVAARTARPVVSLPRLADALGAVLPDDVLVFDEAVSSSRILLRQTPFPDGARVYRTIGGALGWAVPAGIGAKIGRPDRPVVAIVGDGSFHFTPQALWTASQQRAPVVTIVVDNGGYLAVKRAIERHTEIAEDRRVHPGTAIGAIDHLAVAQGYGAQAVFADDADAVTAAVRDALAADRPSVIVVPVPEAR